MSKVFIHATAEVSDKAILGGNTKVWNLAQIRENASIGDNTIISKNVYVDFDVKIGRNVKIQNNVSVYHGVTIEDDVFVGPSAIFTNDFRPRAVNDDWKVTPTLIEKGASIGAGATLICGIKVGQYAMIGSGAVVNKDVPAHALVVGNPAKSVGFVYKNGERVATEHLVEITGNKAVFIHPQSQEKLSLPLQNIKVLPI
ncbi:N-acetyltransferase [Pseudoalteromonas sp. KG3]|uniref:acyltransferase n=1 Tax=Pseudoalteromonas sp. KG3 TaxID=2951137 RepID=UPI002658B6B7|nr:acyltransferase [Pseudoalteromonas sp. KG3]WKD22040.1 N-acetyltransferase [Pseudoalteromonas sp. KG3]